MEDFKAERDEVLVLLERVSEAQRLATMQMKESDGGGKRGGGKRKGEGAAPPEGLGKKSKFRH
jgi:ATP-dependent RNA helicase DDX47/RRP3